MKTFVNFSNHPIEMWDEKQIRAAEQYGKPVDIRFPSVDPRGDEAYIEELAEQCVEQILREEPETVLCQGEFCLAFSVVEKLKAKQITVVAACSERRVEECGDHRKVTFIFERFRQF